MSECHTLRRGYSGVAGRDRVALAVALFVFAALLAVVSSQVPAPPGPAPEVAAPPALPDSPVPDDRRGR